MAAGSQTGCVSAMPRTTAPTTDIDECALSGHNCSANAACTNTPGGFNCACNVGYSGSGTTCTDTNECADGTHNCHANASCNNTVGGFSCACTHGYTGNGVDCTGALSLGPRLLGNAAAASPLIEAVHAHAVPSGGGQRQLGCLRAFAHGGFAAHGGQARGS